MNEPKAHQTGRKRQNVTKTGNDWDYYYDRYETLLWFFVFKLFKEQHKRKFILIKFTLHKSICN